MRKVLIVGLILLLGGCLGGTIWYFNKVKINDFLTEKEIIKKELLADYYDEAHQLLETMTLDEKISQTLLVRHPSQMIWLF